MKKFNIIFVMLLTLTAFISWSCGGDNSSNPDDNDNTKSYANVTWTDNTVRFEENDLVSHDSDYYYLEFSSTNAKAKELKEGDIIFVYGKALKKVYSVSEESDVIYVETEDCRLDEAIKDGEIFWNEDLRFTPDLIDKIEMNSKEPFIKEVTGNEVEFTFPIGNDMEGTIKLTLNDVRLDAKCEITKKVGIAKVKYAFEGYAQKMKATGKIKYTGQELKVFNYQNKNIEGEVTVSLTATGSSSDLLNGIEIPFPLLKIPIIISGIPVMFNVNMLFVINTQMASLDASAYIKTKFTFNSETGISYDGTDVGVSGSAGQYNYDFIKDSCWVASSTLAGINFGLTFPRLELAIFGNTIVPYAQTAFLIGGSFTAGTKPCLKIDASYIGAVGYDFDFLGLLKFSGKKNLWQWDKNIKKIGECE